MSKNPMNIVPKMFGKSFEAVVCLLSIGLLQHVVFGCQTNSDCLTESTTGSSKECCYNADPPRCMGWLTCYLYHKDVTKPTPVRYTVPDYNRFTVPDYNRFTVPDYDRFTVPDYDRFTVPDYDRFTVPDYNIFTAPDFDKFTVPDINDYYNSNDSDNSSGDSSGATIAAIVSVVLVAMLITCLRWVRYSAPAQRRLQRYPSVPPQAPTNTGRGNLVAQQDEEPSRIIIIAVPRDEDHQNRPLDGEPPFLSEEDILSNLHNRCAQEPPSYEDTIAGPNQFPQNQGLDNTAIDEPLPSTSSDLQATPSPNVNPPTYEESLTSNN